MPKRPHRLSIDLEPELYTALLRKRAEDRLSHSDRVRALLRLSLNDADIDRRMAELLESLRTDER